MTATVAKLEFPSMRNQVSPEEWQTRVNLAACYRLVAHHGWAPGVGTHISARVPGEADHFLLNPHGLLFREVTASSLVKVDMQGNKLTQTPYRINHAAPTIHGMIYKVRPDLNAAIHTHTETGMAISMIKDGLMMLSLSSAMFHKRVGYHDFQGPGDTMDDCVEMGQALGQNYALIMRNHGLMTVGRSVGEAFGYMFHLELAIAAQLRAMSTGRELIIPSASLADEAAEKRVAKNNRLQDEAWPTWLRLADTLDPSYRD